MTKKTSIPIMLLSVRLTLLAAIIASLCLEATYLFVVLFIVVEALDICDVVLAMRNPVNFSRLGIVSSISARLLYIVPLIFLAIYKNITIWVLLILIFFEIVIGLYRLFANTVGKRRLVFDILYCIYTISIGVAIFINLLFHSLGTIFIFVGSAVGAVFIIYSSVIIGEDGEETIEIEESKSEIEKTITEEESDEIFE